MSQHKLFAGVPLGWSVVLLATAFFLRFFLAPYEGFKADIDDNISRGHFLVEHGVTSVPDWYNRLGPQVYYPPLFCYQEVAVSKLAQGRLAVLQKQYPEVAEVWLRIRFKLLSIAYDLLTGLAILIFLAQVTTPPWPLIGTAAYLLNPCIFLNSAYWGQSDSIHSFFLLAVVLCLIGALSRRKSGWLIAAWGMFALAICQKLQSIAIMPVLAICTVLFRKRAAMASAVLVFVVVTLALYLPFVFDKRWDYIGGVFIRSFTVYSFTQLNAFNLWGLGRVASSKTTIMGVTYAQIGQALYLASLIWLCLWIVKVGIMRNARRETARMFFLAAAYACVVPFMLLTAMHERYIAPAIPFLILAGCLDSRLRWLAIGFSVTYTLNLLYVLRPSDLPPDELAIRNASNFALRAFGSLLNVGMFGWFTARLPELLRAHPPDSAQPLASPIPSTPSVPVR